LYESKDIKESLRYLKIADAYKDSLFGANNLQAIQSLVTQTEEHQKEVAAAKINYQNKLKQYGLLGVLAILSITALILYRNNHQKQKANKVLQATLLDLKATQAQLIQSEKMASLGELTAGIAHEIQNPLNFVNNFSETNTELIDELSEAADKGNIAEVKQLASDLRENEQKVFFHGKRADAIVKGMLQHARASRGDKQPTNINQLADEYLRLSYQGMRAKDKAFNPLIKTNFESNLGDINAVPQDIGRVLLNLFNNAFYAVNEKKARLNEQYKPAVSVATKREGDRVTILVKDNGIGMPEKVKEKVFQPFFTTKPTGEGTGLGLSLSYDIVTKGHGGMLSVHSMEGEGSEFFVQLPV